MTAKTERPSPPPHPRRPSHRRGATGPVEIAPHEQEGEALARRDRQREETHRRVYEAALEIFRRDGVAPARIDDIVRAAGVSRGTFYFHFPTKDLVLLERLRTSERRVAALIAELPPAAPLRLVLERISAAVADDWQADPQIFAEAGMASLRLVSSGMAGPENNPVRAALVGRFRESAAQGRLDPALPPEVLCEIFLMNIFAAGMAWSAHPARPLVGILQQVVQLFLHGAAR